MTPVPGTIILGVGVYSNKPYCEVVIRLDKENAHYLRCDSTGSELHLIPIKNYLMWAKLQRGLIFKGAKE